MAPLIQAGKPMSGHWRDRKVSALTCERCCYVGFTPPSDDELARYYAEEYGTGNPAYYTIDEDYSPAKTTGRADLAAQLAKTFLPDRADPVILELGCAFGGSVAEMRRRGLLAYGLDLNSRAIAAGRARGNAFVADCPPADFPTRFSTRADVILSFHMLEHVPRPGEYLQSLLPILNDGGVALFRVPNGAYLRAWLKGFDSWDWYAFPDHLHLLSPVSAFALAEASGFRVAVLRSNACGEKAESISAWLPSGLRPGAGGSEALAAAGCLSELEFVLWKPSAATERVVAPMMAKAQAFRLRAEASERQIKDDPIAFAWGLPGIDGGGAMARLRRWLAKIG